MDLPQKGNTTIVDGNDHDFVWEDYLEDTHSTAAPPTAFSHVEYSLESGFKAGMKLEIPSSDDCSTYWMASVIMTCGELLSLRYAGYAEDRSADFWFNIKSGEFHPIGWCLANKKKLWPPKSVLDKCADVTILLSEELKNLDNTNDILSEDLAASFMPIDQIKCGMKLEVIEEFDPQHLWIATIMQNVGGRLLLRYDGANTSTHDFWLFYLSDRLQPIGYGKEYNLNYSHPKIIQQMDIDWETVLKESLIDAMNMPFPSHIFEPKIPIEIHGFKENMKLEAVNPSNYMDVCPATVSKVVNDYYFIVTIDDYQAESKSSLCCHSNSPFIFPIKWGEENGIEVKIPRGYETQCKFSWESYLQFCNASSAPTELFQMGCMNMGFENDMKCEAADPFSPSIIKAATIVKIIEPLMWLQFDNAASEKSVITSINSFDIYPVGWCASNSYPLQTPYTYKPRVKLNTNLIKIKEHQVDKCNQPVQSQLPTEQLGKSWCPKIYFNHRCFSGPLLSKSRLAELPQAIGPGPVHLVIHEVISRVVNIAYKSSQVLQILQTTGKCTSSMQQQIIKAKYKGKSYRAIIEVVRNTEQVEDFCKKICTKLECCPYLFGPKHIADVCPSSCHTQTKTKFGYNFVKKHKKVGRPPLTANIISSTSEESVKKGTGYNFVKKHKKVGRPPLSANIIPSASEVCVKRGPGRKKKRKHWSHLINNSPEENTLEKLSKLRDSSASETRKYDTGETQSYLVDTPLIEKKKLKHMQSSNIVTRGAKLPNFGLWHHVSSFHSRRGRPRTRPIRPFPVITGRKVGRPVGSTKKAIADAQSRTKRLLESENSPDDDMEEKVPKCLPTVSKLQSNPLDWSVEDVIKYLQKNECAPLAPLIKDQEIDGQALLMLNQGDVQQYLHLKPEPAKKFCYLIKKLKIEFFTSFYVA